MLLAEDAPEILFFSTEIDGGRDFTPWEAEPIWPGEPFSGGGEDYLKFLTDTALPYLEERFGAPTEPENCALLGYSLGGLFALWALTKTEKFGAGASLSGSLWYPQFLKYLENCPPKKDTAIYLSLGDREPLGGPPVMRTVGDCTEMAKEIFKQSRLQGILRVESRRARQGRHQTLAARRAQTFDHDGKNGGKVRRNAVLIVNDGRKRRGAKRNARAIEREISKNLTGEMRETALKFTRF